MSADPPARSSAFAAARVREKTSYRLNILNIRALLALAPLALTVAGCGPRPAQLRPPLTAALDPLLGFSDPAHCRPDAGHARFLAGLIAGDADRGFKPGRVDAPASLAAAFGPVTARRADGYWVIGVATTGTLFGLPLGRIDHALPEGGDAGDVTYRFDVPVAVAAKALAARGFPVKAGAAVPIGVGETDVEEVMSLLPDPDSPARSLFGCGYA
ncbi:MAG: hypothetical protein V4659_13620 [Pseudomonadota bacterium]